MANYWKSYFSFLCMLWRKVKKPLVKDWCHSRSLLVDFKIMYKLSWTMIYTFMSHDSSFTISSGRKAEALLFLFVLHTSCCSKSLHNDAVLTLSPPFCQEVALECQDMNWGTFKPILTDALINHLDPIQVFCWFWVYLLLTIFCTLLI